MELRFLLQFKLNNQQTMKTIVASLLGLLHLTCGSLLEESFEDVLGRYPRAKEQETGCAVSEFSSVQDLNLQKLEGEWFETFRARTATNFLSGVWKFQSTKDSHELQFIFVAKLMNQQCMPPMHGTIHLSTAGKSSIIMNYNGLKSQIKEEFMVIETDYDHRTILYGCRHLSQSGQCAKGASVFIILTRHRSFSQEVLDNMKTLAKNVCIDPSSLIQQNSLDSCKIEDNLWTDAFSNSECKKTSICDIACPPCCSTDDNGCVHCNCESEEPISSNKEIQIDITPLIQNNKDERPEFISVMNAPALKANLILPIEDIRNCPSSCRTRMDVGQLICDCSNKELCSPVPHGVPLSCLQQEERYYFDDKSGTCHAFRGSCLDEVNNFRTLKACIDTCADICELPLDPGRCPAGIPTAPITKYYFNRNRGVCAEFVFGGCGGNSNNFESLNLCKHKCPEWMPESSDFRNSPTYEICHQKPKKGTCTGSSIRYFYLPITRTCTSFFYSGCEGNDNNFQTSKECEDKCINIDEILLACPKMDDCPCAPTQREGECSECICEDDGDNGCPSRLSSTFLTLFLSSLLWVSTRLCM